MLRWAAAPPLPLLGMISSFTLNLSPRFHYTTVSSSRHSSPFTSPIPPPLSLSPSRQTPTYSGSCFTKMTLFNCFSAAISDPIPVTRSTGVDGVENEDEQKALVVVSFYKFADFPDHADLRQLLKDLCEELVGILHFCLSAIYVVNSFMRTSAAKH